MSIPLTTRLPIRDKSGNIVDHKEVATYAGLLARKHRLIPSRSPRRAV